MPRDTIRAALIRAARTAAQVMLGVLPANAVGVTEVDWLGAASIGATAAALSLLAAVAFGLPEAEA
jgi:3-deoxy-D-manno-octulosonic-acid transferase